MARQSRLDQVSASDLVGRLTLMSRRPAGEVSSKAVSQSHRRVGENIHSRNKNGDWVLGYGIK